MSLRILLLSAIAALTLSTLSAEKAYSADRPQMSSASGDAHTMCIEDYGSVTTAPQYYEGCYPEGQCCSGFKVNYWIDFPIYQVWGACVPSCD